jgi:hypothetical protein
VPTSESDVGEAEITKFPVVEVEVPVYEVVIFWCMVELAEGDGAAAT